MANYLGTAIVTGEIAPGECLTGEIVGAETLRVSRGAYREAVKVLAAKGLVESQTKIGTRVLPKSDWHLLDATVLLWAFSRDPDMEIVRGLLELRSIVEPAASRLAAHRRDRRDIRSLKSALGRMARHAPVTEEGRAANRDFHAVLLRSTHSLTLAALTPGVMAAVDWTNRSKQSRRGLPRDPLPDHVKVYDAIVKGEAEAADLAMRALIDLAVEDTRSST